MHFCIKCSNMYYIRLSEEDPNSIVYYCRNCGHENKNITLDSVTISRTNFKSSKQKYHITEKERDLEIKDLINPNYFDVQKMRITNVKYR